MFASIWPAPLDDITLRTVAFGLAALGAVAGVVGTFAVVRKQSLQGDAISHAALPGIALAFIFGARSGTMLIVGAAIAGWIAMILVGGIVKRSRVPFDASLAGALAVFFGFGIVLMIYLQKLVGRPAENAVEKWLQPAAKEASRHGLERYLFGQAAFLREDDLLVILAFGAAVMLVVLLFWKEFKLVSFDRDYAASLGYPTRMLDALLTTAIVIAVVIGLQSVGVVLMSALLVAPASAARLWTNRLGRVALLSAVFGAAAGFGGILLSVKLQASSGRTIPAGPTVVLCATAIALVSIIIAPILRKRGQIPLSPRGEGLGVRGPLSSHPLTPNPSPRGERGISGENP